MQKLSTYSVKGILMALVCLLFVGLDAKAVRSSAVEDLNIDLKVGETYEYKAFQSVYVSYVATENGVLRLENHSPYGSFLSQTKGRYVDTSTETLKTAVNGVLEVEVQTGATYYFYQWMMDAGSFTSSFRKADEVKLELVSVTPQEGSVLSSEDASLVSYAFNNDVLIDNATITSGAQTATVEVNITSERFASLDVLSVLTGWLKEEKVKAGDDLTITLNKVRYAKDQSIIYGEDGSLSVTYKIAAKALELVSVTGASLDKFTDFLSYYVPSNPASKIVLTFDGNLLNDANDAPKAVLNYGDLDLDAVGGYYQESIPVTVEGNTATVDLSGKLRRTQDMTPNYSSDDDIFKILSIKVANLKSEDGQFIASTQPGAVGSISFMFNLVDVTANVASDFTPANGSSLTDVDNLEIWIQNDATLIYEGVRFDYVSGGANKSTIVMNDKIEKIEDPADNTAMILTVPVPRMIADEGSEVKVSLSALSTVDGLDHSQDVVATYQAPVYSPEDTELKILSCNYENGGSYEKIPSEGTLTLTTSKDDEIGFMIFDIKDITTDEIVKSTSIFQKEENGWSNYFYYDCVLMEGHQYELTVTAYKEENDYNYGADPLGVGKVTWNGLTKPYEYSDATLVSITPEPTPEDDTNLETPVKIETADEDYSIDLTFSKAVDVNAFIIQGFGMTADLKSVTSNEDKTVWTLVIGKEYLASAPETIQLSVSAKDEQGRTVKATHGEDDGSYWILYYSCTVQVPDVTISTVETAGVVTGLKFDCTKFLSQSYLGSKEIKIYDLANRTVVYSIESGAQFTPVIPEEEQDNPFYQPNSLIYYFDKPLADGAYNVILPRGYFILGEQFDSFNNKEEVYNFTVGSSTGDGELDKTFEPASVTPSGEESVYSIKEIRLKMPTTFSLNEKDPKEVSLVGRLSGSTITGTLSRDPEDEFFTILVTLEKEVTTPDSYMLIIPEEAFGDDEYGATEFAGGKCNPKLMYSIVVVAAPKPIEITPADGAEVEELSEFFFKGIEINDYAKEMVLKDKDGNELAKFNADKLEWVFEDGNWENFLGYRYTLDETITEPGDYTLEIPEGMLAYSNFEPIPAMTLTYHIAGPATGIQNVWGDNAQVTVYTIDGVLLYYKADASVVKNLKKGLYIINGKKVAVK